MKEIKGIVLCDMDQTIADWEGHFLEKWRETYPDEFFVPTAQRRRTKITDDYPPHLHQAILGILTAPGFFRDLQPLPCAIDGLKGIAELGYEIYLCTVPLKDYRYCVAEKYEWVDRYLGQEYIKNLILTTDKTMIRGNFLIDDKPDIPGIYVPEWQHILCDAPYNRHIKNKRRMTWDTWRNIFQ